MEPRKGLNLAGCVAGFLLPRLGTVIHGRLIGNEPWHNAWLEFVWPVVGDEGCRYRVAPTGIADTSR